MRSSRSARLPGLPVLLVPPVLVGALVLATAAGSYVGPVAAAPSPEAAAPPAVRILTRDADGAPLSRRSQVPRLDASGRRVVFATRARLVPEDRNGVRDVYLRDRRTGTYELVSATPEGAAADAVSTNPDISADGRWVVFDSYASDLTADATGELAVYRVDRWRDRTRLVAESAYWPSVSDDGRSVAVERPGGVVWLVDLLSGDETLVSHAFDDPDQPVAESWAPTVSADGAYVSFYGYYDGLVAPAVDANGTQDVFRWERATGEATLVSATADGTSGDDASSDPTMSADGSRVAFVSAASDLVAGEVTGDQVYVRDLDAGTTELVTTTRAGDPSDGHQLFPQVSRDGTAVAFLSTARGLVAGARTTTVDAYVRNLATGVTRLASQDRDGDGLDAPSGFVDLSADGRRVVFTARPTDLPNADPARTQVYLWQRP